MALKSVEAALLETFDKSTATRFKTASAAWRKYREAECAAAYTSIGPASVTGTALLVCKIGLTTARQKVLRDLYPTELK